jgi:hypothetical protein
MKNFGLTLYYGTMIAVIILIVLTILKITPENLKTLIQV